MPRLTRPPSMFRKRIMEAHRSRRTRDQARKLWYAHYRQVRFARWFGFIAEDAKLDQFFRVVHGTGEAVLDGVRTPIQAGFAVLVPAEANHNIVNTGSVPLKLYTLYAPPNHRDGVVHHTRDDAEADNEHFDGKTTE